MGFFDIEKAATTPGIILDMPKFKYIWIYVVVILPITLVVLTWWMGKRSKIVRELSPLSEIKGYEPQRHMEPSDPADRILGY